MHRDLCFAPAVELARRLARGELSSLELTTAYLARIEAQNVGLGAFVAVLGERALAQARAADRSLAAGRCLGALHGLPIAIKDLFDFLPGVPNTFGSRVFEGFVPDQTATYVRRLEDAGAVVLGKTNTPEFGHKGVTDNLLFGPTSTPFDLTRNAGGSSGGSAAAVADGLCALAQGSDAGGSIRIPAAHCGVVGFKPSWGRVAAAYRPDGFLHTPALHAGPITRTVADAALMASVMCGPDARDPLCLPDDGLDWAGACALPVDGLVLAFSPDLGGFPVDAAVSDCVARAVSALGDAGLEVRELSPDLGASHHELTELWLREMAVLYAAMAANMKRDGVDLLGAHRDALCPEFVELLERGEALSAVEAKRDDVLRTRVFDGFQDVFGQADVLACPTVAVPPFPNAADGSTLGPSEVAGQPTERSIGWCLTHPVNFSGHPAISVPAGLTPDGLPVGLAIVGRRHDDGRVLAVAAALERVRPWLGNLPGLR
ncbi:MAG: amidase [Planctomycetota bacterium]|nr:MAG: amidase [Planctomycetota bacterium]